ncbi:MAG: TonB-dependent receptor [Proteobacteria bacterium]|nr:TonB-dependent receptor [Pseudomonadota bacterium]
MLKSPPKAIAAAVASFVLLVSWNSAYGAQDDDLSLEDLTKTEVSSVSRRNQSLSNVPAAAFVITSEDIRRSGALALPDVLRMVPGIQVAQIDSGRYAVTARGFNGRFANKLQVLVDGRSIYNPFFSGTVWEQDAIPLEDIERIEVIRGAGAAMWGVNAVNGVINIISKHSRSQTGGMLTATLGAHGQGGLYMRGGGEIDPDTSWKLSAQGRQAEASRQKADNSYSQDELTNGVVDFRFDRTLGAGSDLGIWANAARSSLGDLYPIEIDPTNPAVLRAFAMNQTTNSQTVGGRYRWLTGGGIESSLQSSLTAASVGLKDLFEESHTQFDLDYQGRYAIGDHDVLWGLSHRSVSDDIMVSNTMVKNQIFTMAKHQFTQRTSGVFLHDDWTLVEDKLRLGLGARWDHTNLGGTSFAPSATLMWTPSRTDTLWTKYSRAPRMPARAEQDVSIYHTYLPPSASNPLATVLNAKPGSAPLKQETMEGVEIGWRSQLTQQFGVDVSAYRYRYSNIVSSTLGNTRIELITLPLVGPTPYVVQELDRCNCANGWLSGAELSIDWLVSPVWRLQLSYTRTQVDMDDSDNSLAQSQGKVQERSTARHYGSLRSQWNVSSSQQFDAWVRGSSGFYRTLTPYTTEVYVPGYVTLDLRYAFKINKDLEIAVSGRNLIGARHIEYATDYVPATPALIAPSAFISGRWKF